MKHFLLSSAAALSLILVTVPAQAVDVSNLDETTFLLTVDESGTEQTIEIFAGETLEGVCEQCKITTEDGQSLELSGNQVAIIKGGKLSQGQSAN